MKERVRYGEARRSKIMEKGNGAMGSMKELGTQQLRSSGDRVQGSQE